MSKDVLDQMLEFLTPDARIDLKFLSLDYLVGVSASEEGIKKLLRNERIMQAIIDITEEKMEDCAKNALLILVNISSHTEGSTELLKYRSSSYKNILELMIGYVVDPQKKDADAASMILSNVTRLEDELEVCIDTFIPHLNDIMNAFVNVEYNKKGSFLNYIAPMISNLSCSHRIRRWLTEENPHIPLLKLLPFCNYDISTIRRGGAIGTIRNLAFDTEFHDFLLSPDLDLLSHLLMPIMGNEDYIDEEMDQLPISLQFLPKEKRRDADTDIRKMIIETLTKLCTKRKGREYLRANGVYYVLREYHKWEKDPLVLLACENVVDILIQKEEEIGIDDFSSVQVPDDMKDNFKKMDDEYLKSIVD